MTDTPLDTYIKSPPPADERSHFNYLEDQLTKLENVSKKHVVRIGDNNESAKALVLQEANARVSGDEAQATYTQTVAAQTLASATALVNTETTARTTADSALASQITSLTATVGTNTAAITSESSVRATADEALGTRIDNLVLTNGSSAAVIIDEEATARIAADYALGVRIDSLTATVGTNTAAISTEQTTRATRDDALAKQLFTMSSGSSRIYVATSAPSSTGRQAGDVWFDSSTNNYKPYVWARSTPTATSGAYDWRDNSGGSFTNLVGNYAAYTQAISTLNTTTSSQASSITALQTTVGNSSAGLVRDVSALSTAVGDSFSGLVKDVTTLQSTTAQQRIFRQATAPSTSLADRKTGDLWYDTSNNNAPYFWNGSGWVANPDNTRATTAALATEQSARSSADAAVAAYALTASAGTGRVYTSNPGNVSRQNGDVWFKTEENFKPYVWYSGQWNDNSSGAYTQYVGQIASVTQTASAAYSTANSANTTANSANTTATTANATANTLNSNLSYQWAIQGTISGQPVGSMKLTGVRQFNPDGTYSDLSNLVIDSNVSINGNLLVSGTINGTKIANGAIGSSQISSSGVANTNISNNAVSNNGFITGDITSSNASVNTSVSVRPNGRAQFIAVLDSTGSVRVYSEEWTNNTQTGITNTTAVAESAKADFTTIGYLNVKRSITGESDVVKSYKFIGYKSASGTEFTYFDTSGRWKQRRWWDYEPSGVAGVVYYTNTSSTDTKTVTYTISTTSGANSGSVVAASVTGSATELSK